MFKFNVVQGLVCPCQDRYDLLVHGNNLAGCPSCCHQWKHIGTSGSWTHVWWVQVCCKSNPIQAYRPNGQQCRRKADLDFLTFCVLEKTTGTTVDDLDENGTERPRLPRAVMDRHSWRGPELTAPKAVSDQWHYALVVQAGDDDNDDEVCCLDH